MPTKVQWSGQIMIFISISIPDQMNGVHNSLIYTKNVISALLHMKLGLMKNFVEILEKYFF